VDVKQLGTSRLRINTALLPLPVYLGIQTTLLSFHNEGQIYFLYPPYRMIISNLQTHGISFQVPMLGFAQMAFWVFTLHNTVIDMFQGFGETC
jgi:hypothetical protein